MTIGESAIGSRRVERRDDEEHVAIEAARRMSRRSLAFLRLLRIQSVEALRSIDAHAQQLIENQQQAIKEQRMSLAEAWKRARAPKIVEPTFTPLTGSHIQRGIDSKMTDVHDRYVDTPLFLSKLAVALNDIEGYVDSERDLTFRGWASVATQGIFRALESGDLETSEELASYEEGTEKMREEARTLLSQQLAWILDTYLRGRDQVHNTGVLIRSEPNIRLFSNLLLFLEFWDAHEVREGAPVRILSSERVRALLEASWEQVHHELLFLSAGLTPTKIPEDTTRPLDEDEQRLLVMRPEEKVRHILELLRTTQWVSGSVEGDETTPLTKVEFPEHVHHQIAEQVLAESFIIDRLVGSAASDVYAVHIAKDTNAPENPGVLPEKLQEVLLDKTFENLAVLPLPALQTYCNDLALSGLLKSVVHGSYKDKKGKTHPFTFGPHLTERLRDYMASAGLARTRELIDGFSPEARKVLGLDSFVHTYREEVPTDAQTTEGFISTAERALTNIPLGDERRKAYAKEYLPLIRKICIDTMSTQGAAPFFRFVNSLVGLGLIEEGKIESFLTNRKNGVFKNFDKQAREYLGQVAAVDIGTAIQEFNVLIDSPLGKNLTHATQMQLARTLQEKLHTVLSTHGSYQALMFFGALEHDLVRSPSPALLTREVLREWLDAIEFDNRDQLSQVISRSDLG